MLDTGQLDKITTLPQLVDYLRYQLHWPIPEDLDYPDLTFDWSPEEFGLSLEGAAGQIEIKQLRPVAGESWGIFFLALPQKKIPVTVLRRILGSLQPRKRASANPADRAVWNKRDLIFIAAHGDVEERGLAFAHFHENREAGDLPTLNVLGWDNLDTVRKLSATHQTLKERLHWREDGESDDDWRKRWASAFRSRPGETIATSKAMAKELARLAREIRRRANELLAAETDKGPLRTLHKAFKEALIHDLGHDDFADMYAQTIAYGLLSARISRESGALVADNAVDLAPPTNPFLKELLGTFLAAGGRKGGMDFDELGVNEVVETLRTANMEAVLRDFDDRNPNEDPVIHFYELFLKEYDPKKRMQRGVFYTPRPVVSFIVRSVDEVLRTEFGLEDGVASTATWADVIAAKPEIALPAGAKDTDPFVRILDPATGTGTFLVETIGLIAERMKSKWQAEGCRKAEIERRWNAYVPEHLLPRLYGFELMMAPYAIAHMKLGLKLYETGYRFGSDARARIYLTNALEPHVVLSEQLAIMSEALAHEATAANTAKSAIHTIVIGNPPYSNFGRANENDWIRSLTVDFWGDMADESKVNLYDDYIKFIRLSVWKVEKAKVGVVGFITNRSFLDGATQREMRKYLLQSSSSIDVIDLYRGIYDPDSQFDTNVFDITTGVAVTIISRFLNNGSSKVSFSRIVANLPEKFNALASSVRSFPNSRSLTPAPKDYLLIESGDSFPEYQSAPKLSALFVESTTGVQTNRDALCTDENSAQLLSRIVAFSRGKDTAEAICRELDIPTTSFWSPQQASYKLGLKGVLESQLVPYAYRPFENIWIYYDDAVVHCPRELVGSHLIGTDNISLLASRGMDAPLLGIAFVARGAVDKRILKSARGEAKVYPLRLQSNSLVVTGTGESNLYVPPSFDCSGHELFHYAYALLMSPTYRERYQSALRLDYPRILVPASRGLIGALVPLGTKLVALHLLDVDGAPELKDPRVRFAGSGEARVAQAPVWSAAHGGNVRVGPSRWFEGVPERAWNHHIGGYQPAQKWLKDRAAKGGKKPSPGRVLTAEDILHYRRMIVSMDRTIDIMAEIDRVIDAHGGWPEAFRGMTGS